MQVRQGLTEREVEISRQANGSNVLTEKKKKGFWRRYLEAFSDPIIRILLGALVLNLAISYRDINWFEIGGILSAVLFSTLVSTFSESGSEAAFQRLAEQAAEETCRLRRGGVVGEYSISQIVVGDVVLLDAGERVPADGFLLCGAISVDQSALNGESIEVKKQAGKSGVDSRVSILEQEHAVGRGSLVTAGSCEVQVCAVGDRTYYGQAAAELQSETRPSPLKHRLSILASNISFIGYVAAGMVAFAYLFYSFFIEARMDPIEIRARLTDLRFVFSELLHALTMAVSILVVAVPEGLPMMITVVLSSNTKRMLKDHVIVRKLVGIETAGSLNILFTDKTGTLTEGKMKAVEWCFGTGQTYRANGLRQLKKTKELLAASMILNNSATYSAAGDILGGNATDRSVLAFGQGISGEIPYQMLEKTPFDSEKKYSATVVEHRESGKKMTLFKGAPEYLIRSATHYMDADGEVHATDRAFLSRLDRLHSEASAKAYRVLAFALKENEADVELHRSVIFLGLLLIRDRVRREVPAAISEAHGAGVQVVMITGDNPTTARAVAEECGIISGKYKEVLTGEALSSMSDEELKKRLPELAVVARAVPTDKTRLVRLAQEIGLVAGMTGDGVNDAPALKQADVGFAMGSGTDVAREAGDVLISDNNFSSIARAILYGRTIFDSIRKFILFQLTMNLSAVGICLIGPFIGVEEPVTVTQMLWVNMIMDTLGGLAFAGEPPLKEYMRQPPKARDEKLITGGHLCRILSSGFFTVALSIWFLKSPFVGYKLSCAGDLYRLSAFFAMFIFCGIFISFNSRTSRINLASNLSGNRLFLFIMALVSVMQLLFIYFGGEAFRTVPLKSEDLVFAIVTAVAVIPADLVWKLLLRQASKRIRRSAQVSCRDKAVAMSS